jgi:hypothetical protein
MTKETETDNCDFFPLVGLQDQSMAAIFEGLVNGLFFF